ncbi:hypothetical protein BH10PSE14_BH10PSE14_09980 [soil metagenome]
MLWSHDAIRLLADADLTHTRRGAATGARGPACVAACHSKWPWSGAAQMSGEAKAGVADKSIVTATNAMVTGFDMIFP